MENVMIAELMATAVFFVALAIVLGFLVEKWMGLFIFGISALIVSAFTVTSTLAGFYLGEITGAWTGLLVGIVLAWPLVFLILKLFNLIIGVPIEKGVRRFMMWHWFGFWGLAVFGHLAGGWIGLLTLALPALALFWIGLYRISAYHLLPLRNPSQRRQAFRSLLTFTFGTNYPYYFIGQNSQPDKRVDGDAYLQFLAGPGIVYSGCDHAAYVSDSVFKNRIFEPGLNFTGTFDQPPRMIDLRPQLGAFSVEALTKDDISIKVKTLIHFKIDTGQQVLKLGQSFPVSHDAIQAAATGDLIERTDVFEPDKEFAWDDQLVGLVVAPIVQQVINQYTVDELCGSANLRDKIVGEVMEGVTEALGAKGLQVLGGGFGNLTPQSDIVVEKRFDNWRREWEGKILDQVEPDMRQYLLELKRAKTESDLIRRLAQMAKESTDDESALLLRLLEMGETGGLSKKR